MIRNRDKMIILLLFSFLLFAIGSGASVESDLPIYLRGIGWPKVQAELRKDLRLSPFVRPTFYDIYLNVSISGYGNATKSDFDGTVWINLEISAPIREIELHALGLNIEQANIFLSHDINSTLNDNKFRINEERESIVIQSSRLIQPGEDITLLIQYNGMARMNGEGLYESWNKRENSSDGPYISLVTHCEPAVARKWFPCFDEPDKKAIFQISVAHPEKTTAYSNTRVHSTDTENGIRFTNFEPTVPLPTYLVAIAITKQPVEKLDVNGYEFRALGFNRKAAVKSVAEGFKILRNFSIFVGVPFIPEKTDIIIVEDYNSGAMENPGLMTYRMESADHLKTHVHELAHQYFGNLVTLSTWADIWVNEGFASFYESNQNPKADLSYWSMSLVSLHDIPMHSESNYTNSFYLHNSFRSHGHIHYSRAAQLMRMIRKFVGHEVFDRAIKRYLIENSYANGDATTIINNLVEEYNGGNGAQLRKILNEWIYQPGIAVIFMERDEDQVKLRQSRLHSTFFDKQLRDETTRFTIPLFCTIDGELRTILFDSEDETLTIPLSMNSSFEIENNYGGLFGVWSKPMDVPEEVEKWVTLSVSLVRYGMLSVEDFYDAVSPFLDDSSVLWNLRKILSQTSNEKYNKWENYLHCSPSSANSSLSDLFPRYLEKFNGMVFFCSKEASDKHLMKRFLQDIIINDKWKIKSDDMGNVLAHIEHLHPGASMEFVMEEFERNPNSIALRTSMRKILGWVNYMGTLDRSLIEQFVRKYPARAAEVSEEILQILEEVYVIEEKKKKNREMIEKFGSIFENSPSQMSEEEYI